MVLLHLLHRLASERNWRLTVAHFNHQLRGRSSGADESFVRRATERLNLPCLVERGAVKDLAREERLSVEMAARRLRHDFLARAARVCGARVIALAHHADDQVELFFLRLLRGAGGGGLAGMRWSSPSPADAGLTLVRPLLDQPKSMLTAFAQQEKIRFRRDASNRSLEFQRNRVRHELLPLLTKHYQPALARVLLRQMEILGAEAECLDDFANEWLRARKRLAFARLPVAVQRRVLHLQILAQGEAAEFDVIEQLRQSPGRPVTVRPDVTVQRDETGLVGWHETKEPKFNAAEQRIHLTGAHGRATFAGTAVRWRFVRRRSSVRPKPEPGCEWFDADKVGRDILLRHWQAGDSFHPIGLGASVKLQNFFTNQKIPRARRHQLLVATSGGEILWVEGLRISDRFKITEATSRLLQWRWERHA